MHMYAVELLLSDSHWTTKMSMDNRGGRCLRSSINNKITDLAVIVNWPDINKLTLIQFYCKILLCMDFTSLERPIKFLL